MELNASNVHVDLILKSLYSYWTQFLEQVPGIILGLIIIILGYQISIRLGELAKKRISHNTTDPLMSKLLGNIIKGLIFIFAVIWALKAAGLNSITNFLFTTLGASAIIVGLSFKDIGGNFLSGIILAFNRPFNVNDTVKIGENFGQIKSLEFLYTKITTYDGRDVFLPNSDVIRKPVINYTDDGFFRCDFQVEVLPMADLEDVKRIIREILKSEPDVVENQTHTSFVAEKELLRSNVILGVYFWVSTNEFRKSSLIAKGKVVQKVKDALWAKNYLPKPYQVLGWSSDENNVSVQLKNPL